LVAVWVKLGVAVRELVSDGETVFVNVGVGVLVNVFVGVAVLVLVCVYVGVIVGVFDDIVSVHVLVGV